MSNFLLSDKDFESVKSEIGETGRILEIYKVDKDDYAIFEHLGNSVFERGTYTKKEMETIWQMLSTKK